MRSATLPVPGATLYYEMRGTGPLLLSIPGGGGDTGVFDEMADVLERHFTMVALAPRGHSRSTLDDPEDRRITARSEDAYRLLTHLTDQPAFVFGTSAGAVVCLDLLTRHPERLGRTVTEFAGGHNGIRTHTGEFARRLVDVLAPEADADTV